MRNECNIIRDILPLYIEELVSEDTVSFVEEHLNGCAECRVEMEKMKEGNDFETLENSRDRRKKDIVPLKLLKKKMRNRKIATIIISCLSVGVLAGCFFFFAVFYGVTAKSDAVNLQTEFQYNDSAYLDQSFALHIMRLDGLPLNATVKNVYETDEYGKKILIGYEVIPRSLMVNWGQHAGSYTIGYAYIEETAPSEDFNFTITVKFQDKTVVYSMVEEGLFVPQENVKNYGY